MKEIFRAVCQKIGNPNKFMQAYEKMIAQHDSSPRFYHTFHGHIAACIKELEITPNESVQDKDVVIMALFLHDAVMDFSRSDNEEQSAIFAIELCREMQTSNQFAQRVAELIRVTKHNAYPINDNDAQLVIDIDLSILGQDKSIFDEYEKNIRREYSFVSENVFKEKRAEILQGFLDRPSIFLTKYFQRKYEAKARKNLAHSINLLKQ